MVENLRKGSPDDLLVDLRQLSCEDRVPVAEYAQNVLNGPYHPVRRFVEHKGTVFR